MLFVGIDPSLSATGLAIVDEGGGVLLLCTVGSKPAPGLAGRCARYRELVMRITNVIFTEMVGLEQERRFFIEGYSYGSKGNTIYQIAEFGGLLRSTITRNTRRPWLYEVAPSTLKKFAAGKGNASKAMVCEAIGDMGHCFSNNNEADALALALLGRLAITAKQPANMKDMPAYRLEAVATVQRAIEAEEATW